MAELTGTDAGDNFVSPVDGLTAGSDRVAGRNGDDILWGLGGDDKLYGMTGSDTLKGGAGADELDGGVGVDTASYVSDFVDDPVTGVSVNLTTGVGSNGLAAGDTLTSIENVIGTPFADGLTGNFEANVLTGGNGGDTLKGGAGDDTLDGGSGDDFLWGGSGADTLNGGADTDTLIYVFGGGGAADSVDTDGVIIVLDASGNGTGHGGFAEGDTYTSIENVIGSTFDDAITGNASVNVLQGLDGNDTLNGGGGGDTLDGGIGNDTYIVDNVGVTLLDSTGTDTVQTSLTFSIQALPDFENITLTGAANINATGNETANVINGNNAINIINGRSGNDTINGNGGNDNLQGSAGSDKLNGGTGFDVMNGANGFDTLTGGNGRDTMTGGLHRDVFDYNAAGESKGAFRDIITDFQKGVDDIDLSTIDAKSGAGNQAFTFIGQAAFSGVKGQLHIKFSGANTIVEGDIDGNGAAARKRASRRIRSVRLSVNEFVAAHLGVVGIGEATALGGSDDDRRLRHDWRRDYRF